MHWYLCWWISSLPKKQIKSVEANDEDIDETKEQQLRELEDNEESDE